MKVLVMNNNESLIAGVFKNGDGTYTAMTYSQSKTFKTKTGAERWYAKKSGGVA